MSTRSSVNLLIATWICAFVGIQTPATAQNLKVAVGSKSFTESVILGEVLSHLASDAGADVQHRAELGGTQILWQALVTGEIDAYVDYTGTIREEILADVARQGIKIESESDMRTLLRQKKVLMSERVGFNNTYALGMRRSVAQKMG
ncbi:MAG: glycine betaine ABC transporter substrate-binding protein, partial [Planctomycetota bacterium]